MNKKIIRVNSTLWAVAIKTFKPRRNIPEVVYVHGLKQNKLEEEEKVVENEEVSKISVEQDKR